MSIRRGIARDGAAAARLHVTEISEGFLSGLGAGFLTPLYRRIAVHPGSFLLVADEGDGVIGFAAATEDLGQLYRSFLLHDGLVAVARSAPRLARSWRQVVETLRYPAADGPLPRAELVSVAVDHRKRGRGLGRALVDAATEELSRRGVTAARVVAGAGNGAALGLYQACGFRPHGTVELHHGRESTMLTWP